MEVFKPSPKSLLNRGSKTSAYFNGEGNLLHIPTLKPMTLEALIDGNHEVTGRPDDIQGRSNRVCGFLERFAGSGSAGSEIGEGTAPASLASGCIM
jgi:hypothetical protein